MKNTLFLFVILATVWVSCQNEGDGNGQNATGGPNSDMIKNPASALSVTDTNQLARIHFEEAEFNFDTVNENSIVEHVFKFTNTGKVPLTILKARSSCGCTIPEWPEAPIAPGGTGEISAKFNTEGKSLHQSKIITVTANTYPNETRVKLKGYVMPVKE
jgi:hypothetical protein